MIARRPLRWRMLWLTVAGRHAAKGRHKIICLVMLIGWYIINQHMGAAATATVAAAASAQAVPIEHLQLQLMID